MMEMSFKTKILIYIIINLILLMLLFSIPIDADILNNICLIKHFTGKPCWNCGMTRAFLSILHFEFITAFQFNYKVIIVFPLTIGIYLYSSFKFFMKGDVKDE